METTATSAMSGLIPLAGLAALVACGIFGVRRRGSFSLHALFGSLVFPVVLAVVAFMCFSGLYAGPLENLVVLSVALAAFGVVLQNRFSLFTRRPGWRPLGKDALSILVGLRDVAIVLAAAHLGVLALELSYNDWFADIEAPYLRMEHIMVLCFLATLYFLGGRRGGGVAGGAVALACIGIAQYFVYLFKMAAITPSDLFALGTAMAVSGNYVYIIDGRAVAGALYACTAVFLAGFIVPAGKWGYPAGRGKGGDRARRGRGAARRVASNLAMACVCAAMLWCYVSVPDYAEDAKIHVDSWFTYDSYRTYGWLNTFVTVAQDMVVERPDGYSKETVEEADADEASAYDEERAGDGSAAQAAQEQFDELRPSVVVVMDETFSDLSEFDGLHAGYPGPDFFKNGLVGTVTRGDLSVSVNGGGTCNTEFEFLTGNSMAFFGTGMYPYSTYDFAGCQCLPRQFADMGYTTTAIHPNYPTNWDRDVIYRDMGFQSFLSIEDFAGASLVHNEVSDAATFDKVLELLEGDESPQFIFDVTMQNHSGYSRGGIPEEFRTDYVPSDWGDADQVAALNEYLGCIEASDAALEDFIGKLGQLDRPVVVVFFGDHQPGFTKDINEAFYPEDGSAEYVQRVYRTPYFIWANYDVAGSGRYTQDNPTSASYLSALLMESIGGPMDDYQKTQLQASRDLPLLNLYGFSDSEGNEYLFDGEAAGGDVSPSSSEENAPQACEDALDMLERAQYARFMDN